jgi:hypothetical protein
MQSMGHIAKGWRPAPVMQAGRTGSPQSVHVLTEGGRVLQISPAAGGKIEITDITDEAMAG